MTFKQYPVGIYRPRMRFIKGANWMTLWLGFCLLGLSYHAVIHAWPEPALAAEPEATWTFVSQDTFIDSTDAPDGKGGDDWKRTRSHVTGYTSHVNQTDSTPCIAADGTDICKRYAKGEKICATNDWPMHTKLSIEGLGTCIVADRMNRRYTGTGRIDWYFGMDIEAARKHGVKKLQIEVYKEKKS